MAKDQPGLAQLVHHYTHVVCALNEARKDAAPAFGQQRQEATDAVDKTIIGVCKLIDSLVSQEHRDTVKTGMN
jgi:pyrroline-5-carboxylate reductase